MAGELCEHCESPVSEEEKVTILEGFSYHKKCHKCCKYHIKICDVCSETNLLNAEVFKGVIFCSCCAQRIFQGCSTARRTKTMHTSRGRRPRSRSHRRQNERVKHHDRKPDTCLDGVIELAKLTGSNTDSEDQKERTQKKPSKPAVSNHALEVGRNKRLENCIYFLDQMKRDSAEMGTTTDVTQDLLKSMLTDYKIKPRTPPKVPQRRRNNRKKDVYEPIISKPICCDLRIAELGASTEIANMTLRKNSEVPVTIHSDSRIKGNASYTLSAKNRNSDSAPDSEDWVDSAYSTIEESVPSKSMMDRRLGSILKMPLKLFKKNILNRSSLVSVLMSSEDERSINLFSKIKQVLHEEVVEHQVRGVKRLYSTINRGNKPHKLGWVDLVAKVSRDSHVCSCSYGKRCKHFRNSHSYRCMRAQVMKLAGPTNSELAVYRNKIKQFIVPQCVRKILAFGKNYPTVKLSTACQKSFSAKTY